MKDITDTNINQSLFVKRSIDVHIGKKLSDARSIKGITSRELDSLVGLEEGSITKFEGGLLTLKPLEILIISEILQIKIGFFYS